MTYEGRMEAAIVVPAGVTITATNSGGGPTNVSLVAGTYFLTGVSSPGLLSHLQTQLNAARTPANWTVSLSTGPTGTGKVSINWTGAGTYSINFNATSGGTSLQILLGFTVNPTAVAAGTPSTGARQAKALWLPDCPLMCDLDPGRAPLVSDRRTSVSARGDAYTLMGNTRYRHMNIRYTHVPTARMWEAKAALVNASWETFVTDTQMAMGFLTWFTPGSAVQIYDNTGQVMGIDAAGGSGLLNGWSFETPPELDQPRQVVAGYTGLWQLNLGNLCSSG